MIPIGLVSRIWYLSDDVLDVNFDQVLIPTRCLCCTYGLIAIRIAFLVNKITLLLKDEILVQNLNLFVSDACWLQNAVVWCVWSLYACVLIVCYYFSGDRIKRQVCWGGGGLWVPRRGRPGTSHSRQAIYLLHIWILITLIALLLLLFINMHCFHIAIVS
jgi:hypothetical protein